MKWKVDDDRLPCTVLHTTLYIQEENNTEKIVGECSFTIGEIYIYQPLTTWLNLNDTDEVKFFIDFFAVLFHLIYHRYIGIEAK
jgi:hypothetical protein